MLKNKLNLACLCVAFCFCGCGNEIPLTTRLENIDKEKANYDTSSNTFEVFMKNVNMESVLSQQQRKEQLAILKTPDDVQKWFAAKGPIDFLQDDFNHANTEYYKLPENKSTLPLETDVAQQLINSVYPDGKLIPEVNTSGLEYSLAIRTGALIIFSPNNREKIIDGFYTAYDQIFKSVTGLTFNSKTTFKEAGSEVYTNRDQHVGFYILLGAAIKAIEFYALFQRCITSTKVASLWQIYHGVGTAKDLEKQGNKAYLAFLKAIETNIDKVTTKLIEAFPLLFRNQTKLSNTIKSSTIATILSLKEFLKTTSQTTLDELSQIFVQDEKGFHLNHNDNVFNQIGNGSITVNESYKNKPEIMALANLIKALTNVDIFKKLNEYVQKVNKQIQQAQKKPGTPVKNYWELPL